MDDVEPLLPERRFAHRVLSLSRLVPRKGVGEAVETLRELPDVELVVAGGPDRDGIDTDPEVARLRDLAAELGVAEQVHFVGAVSREDIPRLLAGVDVAVCLPWYEPFGIVPLEIMACAKPLVGTAVGGLLDTVDDGRTGLLVPPKSPQKAARAVQRLLADADLRARMGARARRKVERLYGWDRVAQATESVYEQMLANAALAVALRWAGRAADDRRQGHTVPARRCRGGHR